MFGMYACQPPESAGLLIDARSAADRAAAAARPGSAPSPREADFVDPRLPLRLGRDAAGTADPLPHLRHAAKGRAGCRAQRRADHARHRRHRARSSPAPDFAGELFGPASCSTSAATSSSCPTTSATANRASRATACKRDFPHYGYRDMIDGRASAAHRGPRRQPPAPRHGHVDGRHAHLAVGRDLPGFHGRADAARQPARADLRAATASGGAWPSTRSAAIRSGRAATTPRSRRACARPRRCCGWSAATRSSASGRSPTLAQADEEIDDYVASYIKTGDANDTLYALESSRDYDPGPGLERITAPLLAINSADDLVNPPELGILEREITRVPHGRAIVIPLSDRTVGHGTHTVAAVWQDYLAQLLSATEPR